MQGMTSVRILVLGAGGMLGQAVVASAVARGLAVDAAPRAEVDVTDPAAVSERMRSTPPDLVVNCAAFTQVDACESEPERAWAVNAHAVRGIAVAAEHAGAVLVQVSTDYVFDGKAGKPYGEAAPTSPLSVYGASKLAGERAALESSRGLAVRASWLFGPGGQNFVRAILGRARAGEALRVVDDQVGCPTYTPYLAEALLDLGALAASGAIRLPGVVHYRNREPVSWFGFARAILEVWRLAAPLTPVSSAEFPRPASRPAYSVLDVTRTASVLGRPVESWRDGLEEYRDAGME
jgi:dTDP-4-dehydrorhamnose reductase